MKEFKLSNQNFLKISISHINKTILLFNKKFPTLIFSLHLGAPIKLDLEIILEALIKMEREFT